jgi:iron complex transport system ATP-binding protein
MSLLTCRNLDVSIANMSVVRGLDVSLNAGDMWGLLGANGIGKTTLLKCLAGLVPPDSGEARIGARPLAEMSRREVARKLGMLQQHTVYLFDSNALQIALTGRHPHLSRWDRENPEDIRRAESALDAVDLQGFANRGVTTLSGGEARRLAFAALLVQEPEILLLDEPTNHLDLRHQLQIMQLASGYIAGGDRTALTALHDVNLAARFCSHLLMLFGEGEWQAGTCEEMLGRENLERLYGCEVEVVNTSAGPRFHPLAASTLRL